jgi:adenosylcobinamide kinase/adenosylcobinamide-phosphate guanylyltransferase
MLTLILGGARSGKSRLAQRLAASAGRVTYIATAETGEDLEMAARIARHRADRPSAWRTVEEPLALADAVERAAMDADAVLVDCLTIWLSNLSWKHRDGTSRQVEDAARAELQRLAAAARQCHLILVSNELGCGTVPEPAVTRAFRDAQGLLNQWAAEAADEVILTVAGLPLYLKLASRQAGAQGTYRELTLEDTK